VFRYYHYISLSNGCGYYIMCQVCGDVVTQQNRKKKIFFFLEILMYGCVLCVFLPASLLKVPRMLLLTHLTKTFLSLSFHFGNDRQRTF
jgi:hypothetical protein